MPERTPSLDDQPLVSSGEPNPLPAGETLKTDPKKWYFLKGHYTDKDGKPATVYAYPLGRNAARSFWDYVVFEGSDGSCNPFKFQLIPDDSGWETWNIRDDECNAGYHLDCKATGWLYRGSQYATKFRIVDGKLYCNHWSGPAGSAYRHVLVPFAQYLGMDLPAFTCELEEAP